MKISKGLAQAYQLQDFAFEALMSLKAVLTGEDGKLNLTREDASAIVSLQKAWQGCQERISFHRRVPSPGSLRPKPPAKSTKPRSSGPIGWFSDKSSVPSATQPPSPPAVVPTDMPTIPSDKAKATPPDASVTCPVCHGTRELRISGGNGTMPCGCRGGTGRQPAQAA